MISKSALRNQTGQYSGYIRQVSAGYVCRFYLFITALMVLLTGLSGCNRSQPEQEKVKVGFTSNLHDVQPHLAYSSSRGERDEEQIRDKQRPFLLAALQTREEIQGDILMLAKEAGYDFLELSTDEIAGLSAAEFEEALQWIEEVGLPVPVTNRFIPGDIKLVGPETNIAQQNEYLFVVYERLKRLGVEYIVFGSGGARRVPEGFSRDQAWDQLVAFGRRAAEMAEPYDLTILVEPLRRQETNIINTAGEGLDLIRDIDHPHFQLMIDFYHLAYENEDPAVVLEAGDQLLHLHIANPKGRTFPKKWDEHPFYADFFTYLRETGYDKRISIEGRFEDLIPESQLSIAMMRKAFDPEFSLP